MSSYRFSNITLVFTPSASMSGTATITSQAVEVTSYQSSSFQLSWTGNPTGTISILASNDGTNFFSFGASVTQQPSGSASGTFCPIYASCARYLRVSYTNASGSGTLSGIMTNKTR